MAKNVMKGETMKKTIIKTVFSVPVLVITVFAIASCTPDENGGDHVHNFQQKWDETHHFEECSCGEIIDRTEHTFEWVVDTEPTYSTPGYKHNECQVCGYKTEENTVIERLLHDEVVGDGIVDPTMGTFELFLSASDAKAFYTSNKNDIASNFICINSDFSSISDISIEYLKQVKYCFDYTNSDGKKDYCTLTTNIGIYSEELGTDTDVSYDVPYHSITFKLISYNYSEEINDLRFEFYEYSNESNIWNYIIEVYNGNDLIGHIYYYTGLEINREWISNFLLENLIILQ